MKHARLAMLAAAGWPLAELWHGGLCKIFGAEYLLDATQGRSLSVLNGGLGQVAPFLFLAALGASAVEWKTLDQVYGLTATGKTMKPNGQLVMKSYVPGDCGFDPMKLYGWHGANVGAMAQMRAEADPEFAFELAERSRREMETAEIKNGRLAMLAITGYAFQEFFGNACRRPDADLFHLLRRPACPRSDGLARPLQVQTIQLSARDASDDEHRAGRLRRTL